MTFARYLNHTAVVQIDAFEQGAFGLSDLVYAWRNETGEGVTIRWQVTLTNTSDSNTGTVEILNVAPEVARQLEASFDAVIKGSIRCTLALGWGQVGTPDYAVPEVVLSGGVWRFRPLVRADVDTSTVFEFGSGLQELSDRVLLNDILSSVGVSYGQAAQFVAEDLGFQISQAAVDLLNEAANRRGLTPEQGLVVFSTGDPGRDALDRIFGTVGLQWVLDSQNVIRALDSSGVRNDLPLITLTPASGLLTWETVDKDGVDVRALARPGLQPGQQLAVQDETGVPVGAPLLRVERVEFVGGTDTESTMRVVARPRRGFV